MNSSLLNAEEEEDDDILIKESGVNLSIQLSLNHEIICVHEICRNIVTLNFSQGKIVKP